MKSRRALFLTFIFGGMAWAADPTVKPEDFTEALGDLPDGGAAAKPSAPSPTTSLPATPSTPAAPAEGDSAKAASAPSTASADKAEGTSPETASPPSQESRASKTQAPQKVETLPPPAAASSFDAAADAATNSALPAPNAKTPAPAPEVRPEEMPPEIRALEQSLDAGTTLPQGLYEPTEPGGALRPSERFARIPLRPRMSDANWRKWAGPMLEKNYRIRRRDTLWGISERLFGTPYLWPKVWQLNAVIGNPNVVDPGLELMFTPGNPNSAPMLAFKSFPGTSSEDLPLMSTAHKRGFMEMLDETLRAQILSSHPPFQYFLLDERPKTLDTVPESENTNRVFMDEGESFATELSDGDYNIVHIEPVENKFYSAYRVHWIGIVRVQNRRATITRAFSEISKGDPIVSRSFAISPLALHEERIGASDRESTQVIPLQEGYRLLASDNMLIGVRFAGADRGPRIGALLTLNNGVHKVATLLLIDRDKKMGTAWVIDSVREISADIDRFD